MFFFGLIFLWVCTGIILYTKYRVIVNGKKLQGEIVGFKRPSGSALSFSGYYYIIRFEYGNEIIAAQSMQSKMGTLDKPPKNKKGEKCMIYYNPKYPEKVTIAGKFGAEISAAVLFLIGLGGLIIYLQ
ncbi:MAG TPA: DUF3592 domain-containing protein [Bacillota bacterium]|nr:DUF3592 domain-containing protein [Bacillota bacterium]